jgi:hypothetical protein
VQIGTGKGGMRPVAQNGQVVVVDGKVKLLGSQGDVIAEAPVADVTAKRGRSAGAGVTWVTLGDTRYSVAVGAGGLMLFTGIIRIFKGASGGKRLIAAIEAEKARVSGS